MSDQLTVILQRINRIETMLSKVLREGTTPKPRRLAEGEAMKQYGVSKYKLQQLRQGYKRNGVFYDPVLFKWGHRNGRHFDYDVEELEAILGRKILNQ